MKRRNRLVLTMMMLLTPALLRAETPPEDDHGWTFSQRFQGSSNAAGVVLKTSSTGIYTFNRNVKGYAGFPIYFARQSSSSGATSFMNGIGNAYVGFIVTEENPKIHYTSDLVATAPTGDKALGFSTGHATVDWTNTFSHTFNLLTPYASIGAANTVSDTSFFVRPFTTKGIVGHYEAGALIDVAPHVSVGGSAYGVRATGEQQIVSKVVEKDVTQQAASSTTSTTTSTGGVISTVTNGVGKALGNGNGNANGHAATAVFQTTQVTVGQAVLANDHGFSSWLAVKPTAGSDLRIGYSRSATYQLNSFFFGVGFSVGH